MRLYIRCCEKCMKTVYLSIVFASRPMMRQYFASNRITVHCSKCNSINIRDINQVFAVSDGRATIIAVVISLTLGLLSRNSRFEHILYGILLFCPIGLFLDIKQKKVVEYFNNS